MCPPTEGNRTADVPACRYDRSIPALSQNGKATRTNRPQIADEALGSQDNNQRSDQRIRRSTWPVAVVVNVLYRAGPAHYHGFARFYLRQSSVPPAISHPGQ